VRPVPARGQPHTHLYMGDGRAPLARCGTSASLRNVFFYKKFEEKKFKSPPSRLAPPSLAPSSPRTPRGQQDRVQPRNTVHQRLPSSIAAP